MVHHEQELANNLRSAFGYFDNMVLSEDNKYRAFDKMQYIYVNIHILNMCFRYHSTALVPAQIKWLGSRTRQMETAWRHAHHGFHDNSQVTRVGTRDCHVGAVTS